MNCVRFFQRPYKMHPARIDNWVFRLHYKFTSIILVVLAVLVAVFQWFGEPTYCFRKGPLLELVDILCGSDSQYTVPIGLTGSISSSGLTSISDVKARYLIYPMQPWFTLLAQSLYFYLPYSLWKSLDRGKLQSIISDLNRPRVSGFRKAQCKTDMVNYLAANLHKQNLYALQFFMSETLNLINVVAQTIILHHYIGYYFETNGIDVLLSGTRNERELGITVSKLTSSNCTVRGNLIAVEDYDFETYPETALLCYVPLIIANENICVLLWYWLLCLSVITAGSVLCNLVDLLNNSVHLTVMEAREAVKLQQVKYDAKRTRFGAWFLLNQIRKNIHPEIFKDVVSDLTAKLHKDVKTNLNENIV